MSRELLQYTLETLKRWANDYDAVPSDPGLNTDTAMLIVELEGELTKRGVNVRVEAGHTLH